jgi:sugar transferase (PEP-CTERM/EpsH1 system associated)
MARILILTPQLPVPPQALTGASQGTTIRNFNLIAGLSQRHTVDLVTFLAPDEGETGLLRAYCRNIVTTEMPARSLARRARDTLLSPWPDMGLRLASQALHACASRLLAENDYEVIEVEGIEMGPYMLGPLALIPRNRPLWVFDDHNAEYVLQRRAFLTDVRRPRRWIAAAYSFVQWRKLVGYERRICRRADRVVAVSEADRDALQRLAPGLAVTVVPNGVDLAFYRAAEIALPAGQGPLSRIGPNALVFTGKMDYRPNVDAVLWFVEAVLPRILAQTPDAHFYIVGQRPHSRLDRLAGHPAVTITGRVPDVRPYIAGASVYVVPLRIGGGTRLKVLEAMAMGRPMVSTRLGCDGFPFTDGQQVLFADEPEAFAEAVVRLLRDREAAARLGRAARAYVEAHFGWDAIVPRLEALYP